MIHFVEVGQTEDEKSHEPVVVDTICRGPGERESGPQVSFYVSLEWPCVLLRAILPMQLGSHHVELPRRECTRSLEHCKI